MLYVGYQFDKMQSWIIAQKMQALYSQIHFALKLI